MVPNPPVILKPNDQRSVFQRTKTQGRWENQISNVKGAHAKKMTWKKEGKQRRGKSATKSMCSRKLRVALRVGMFSECIRTTQPKKTTSACPFVRFGRPISCELGRIAEYVSFSKYLIHVKKLKPYLQYSYIVYRNMRYLMTSSRLITCHVILLYTEKHHVLCVCGCDIVEPATILNVL